MAICDSLTRPRSKLTKQKCELVKRLARELLDTLKAERLLLEWRSRQKTHSTVLMAIQEVLEHLPSKHFDDDCRMKCEAVYQHMCNSFDDLGKSVYGVNFRLHHCFTVRVSALAWASPPVQAATTRTSCDMAHRPCIAAIQCG